MMVDEPPFKQQTKHSPEYEHLDAAIVQTNPKVDSGFAENMGFGLQSLNLVFRGLPGNSLFILFGSQDDPSHCNIRQPFSANITAEKPQEPG